MSLAVPHHRLCVRRLRVERAELFALDAFRTASRSWRRLVATRHPARCRSWRRPLRQSRRRRRNRASSGQLSKGGLVWLAPAAADWTSSHRSATGASGRDTAQIVIDVGLSRTAARNRRARAAAFERTGRPRAPPSPGRPGSREVRGEAVRLLVRDRARRRTWARRSSDGCSRARPSAGRGPAQGRRTDRRAEIRTVSRAPSSARSLRGCGLVGAVIRRLVVDDAPPVPGSHDHARRRRCRRSSRR